MLLVKLHLVLSVSVIYRFLGQHSYCAVSGFLKQPSLQVLNLYAKTISWLDKADPGVCVQTNTWTAAALQLAIRFHKVLPSFMHFPWFICC